MADRDEQLKQQAYDEVDKNRAEVERDPYRLTYHIMPPAGLLNDPNGFIQWNGTYHLFYQWMPFKTGHGAKFWGHYTSDNLVRWSHEEIALAPSEWYEKNGCYSGSAIDHDGVMTLFYTGNVKDEDGNRETYQCKAVSVDGLHFKKEGPVITLPEGYTPHFRDPKVWKHGDRWYMIVGAQNIDLEGRAVLFRSDDLYKWEHLGPIAGSHLGQLGDFGYMWECPDLFPLGGKDVLIASPQGLEASGMLYNNVYQAGYFVGELDYKNARMAHGDFTELDRGFEFYAPQTTEDDKGRRILIAWMGVPDQNEQDQPTVKHKWLHTMTLPRVLALKEGKLIQQPVEELESLRKNEVTHQGMLLENEEAEYEGISGKAAELLLEEFSGNAEQFEIGIRGNARLLYNNREKRFTLERKSFVDGLTESRHCYLAKLDSIRVFLDASSVEVFLNGGEEVFTARIFPDPGNGRIVFGAKGNVEFNLKKWDLG